MRAVFILLLGTAVWNGGLHSSIAAQRYVSVANTSPSPPYTSWSSAATNIQQAVDVSISGDEVIVSNGIYAAGGRAMNFGATNRLTVTTPIVIRSVNGPSQTVIQGRRVPSTTNGTTAIRCVYLGAAATLSGFTLTNGATRSAGAADIERNGGGILCTVDTCIVSDCVIIGNAADSLGGGAYGGTFTNCTFAGNAAQIGGGASSNKLYNSVLSGNSATYGGGAARNALFNCLVGTNTANDGGGTYMSFVSNCIVVNNQASAGGGAGNCSLVHCTLAGNIAGVGGGGGVFSGGLTNCLVTGNVSTSSGGGASSASLINCTVTGNSAQSGGGTFSGTVKNSIVYFNTALDGSNSLGGSFDYCCTSPTPPAGIGNFDADPLLASASHVSFLSFCRNAGNLTYSLGTDIDGETWANPPSIGCDEFVSGAVTGAVIVAFRMDYTNASVGFPIDLFAEISGRVNASRWEFGDGTVISNHVYVGHSWATPGDFPVVLRAYNETYPGGIATTALVQIVAAPVHYVSMDTPGPLSPYASWATAAANIQDAVDGASVPGALILVSNGVYQTGARECRGTNRLAVTKAVRVQGLNGAAATVIQGFQVPGTNIGPSAIRCVYLTNKAQLIGFTLTNGATSGAGRFGGGICCEGANALVSDCVLAGNAGYDAGAAYSGTFNRCVFAGNWASDEAAGAYFSTLINCVLFGNNAISLGGGGALKSTLINCTMAGNSGGYVAGGAYLCSLTNCIVFANSAPNNPNYSGGALNYCCTTPLPTNGFGNFTNDPMLVDIPSGNLRLQSGSPAINSGDNTAVVPGPDLDGSPRVVGGTVDIGGYEYANPSSILSYAWLQQHGLATDGSADFIDPDHDGMNNFQEWRAGTDPFDFSSNLRLLVPQPSLGGIALTWQSVPGHSYFLERATNVTSTASFSSIASSILASTGNFTSFTDTNAVPPGRGYYRVGVR